MNTTADNTRTYWMYTIASLVGIFLFLLLKPEWFWVMLPSFFTYFVKAMKWM
jgi:hypothetical protein